VRDVNDLEISLDGANGLLGHSLFREYGSDF